MATPTRNERTICITASYLHNPALIRPLSQATPPGSGAGAAGARGAGKGGGGTGNGPGADRAALRLGGERSRPRHCGNVRDRRWESRVSQEGQEELMAGIGHEEPCCVPGQSTWGGSTLHRESWLGAGDRGDSDSREQKWALGALGETSSSHRPRISPSPQQWPRSPARRCWHGAGCCRTFPALHLQGLSTPTQPFQGPCSCHTLMLTNRPCSFSQHNTPPSPRVLHLCPAPQPWWDLPCVQLPPPQGLQSRALRPSPRLSVAHKHCPRQWP